MTDTARKAFNKQVTGSNDNSWGDVVNTIFDQIDKSIAGITSKTVTTADVTLTADEARSPILLASGALTGDRALIVPATESPYLVINTCSGAFNLTVKTPAGTGIIVPPNRGMRLYCNATNVVLAEDVYYSLAKQAEQWSDAGGTADAITAVFAPKPTAWVDGAIYRVRALGANTVTTPTFTPNSGTVTAKTIVKANNVALVVGDIPGDHYEMLLQYAADLDKVKLLNPNPASAFDVSAVHTFTAKQTYSTAAADTEVIEGVSTDAGANAGPLYNLFRDSASPAASDLIGKLAFYARDSAANKELYADIVAKIIDATNASEDAQILFRTIIAGTLASRMVLGNGLYMAGATSGDMGTDTINAANFFKNGVALSAIAKTVIRKSADQSVASASLTNDSDFTFALAANTKYNVRMVLNINHAAGSDFKFDVTGPASPNSVDIMGFTSHINGTMNTTPFVHATAFSSALSFDYISNPLDGLLVEIYINNGSNSGTFQFRWCNLAGTVSNKIFAGSFMTYETTN